MAYIKRNRQYINDYYLYKKPHELNNEKLNTNLVFCEAMLFKVVCNICNITAQRTRKIFLARMYKHVNLQQSNRHIFTIIIPNAQCKER